MNLDIDETRRKQMGIIADEEIAILNAKSKLNALEDILKLKWDDIELGSTIGFGGFSQVFRVQILKPDADGQIDDKEYALKCLSPNTLGRTKSFKTGAVDLVIEATILSRLSHPNVIKVQAVYGKGPRIAYLESKRGYFLVLDLLADTLRNKIDKYRMQNPKPRKSSRSMGSREAGKSNSSYECLERINSIGVGVAKGMEYLHSQRVVLRDLKPDNVGFDMNGIPKIFDLGFAREFHTLKPKEVAGSLRYMAPEIALGRPTEYSSDVYSFGVLLWEMVTLDKPYKHIHDRDEFIQSVMISGWRNSSSAMPSSALRKLLKECWDGNASHRPTFTRIVKILKVETSLVQSERKKGATAMGMPLPRTTTFSDASGISRKNSLGKLSSFKKFSNSFLKGLGNKKSSDNSLRDLTKLTEATSISNVVSSGTKNAEFKLRATDSTKINPMLASTLLGPRSTKKSNQKNRNGASKSKSSLYRAESNESCPLLFED
jgi:serine/threonine protein kinase